MKRRSGQKGNFIRRGCILIGALICALASFCIALPAADQVKAETVTDTLTIKIGYWGMPETEYVTKAEYHWTQLQKELPVYEQAYSYFRDKENRSYAVIVAAARGFYLEDILNHAGVNVSDVENISFYTNDYAAGAFTSFTPSQLLSEPRYYYDNLASHINNEFNDAGILTGYSVDPSAYDNREQVPTMLALESNWNTFEAGTENTNPVFSGLSTGSRFRLLFGQTDPTEMRTNQSAKYVHTIALTIPGSPEIKGGSGDYTGKIMLSTKLGRHTVTFDVAADEAMLDTIRQKLVWTSSDDSVLRIENIAMDPSAEYDDAVTVRIDYEVLKEGARAAIQGDFMGMQLQGSTIETDPAADGDSEQDQEGGGAGKGGKSGGKSGGKNNGSKSGSGSVSAAAPPASGNTSPERRLSLTPQGGTVTAAQAAQAAQTQQAAQASSAEGTAESEQMVAMDLESVLDADDMKQNITVNDPTRKYAPFLCGGAGFILAMGGAAAALQFKAQMGQAAFLFRRRRSG